MQGMCFGEAKCHAMNRVAMRAWLAELLGIKGPRDAEAPNQPLAANERVVTPYPSFFLKLLVPLSVVVVTRHRATTSHPTLILKPSKSINNHHFEAGCVC
jgi:hypothetical protein